MEKMRHKKKWMKYTAGYFNEIDRIESKISNNETLTDDEIDLYQKQGKRIYYVGEDKMMITVFEDENIDVIENFILSFAKGIKDGLLDKLF